MLKVDFNKQYSKEELTSEYFCEHRKITSGTKYWNPITCLDCKEYYTITFYKYAKIAVVLCKVSGMKVFIHKNYISICFSDKRKDIKHNIEPFYMNQLEKILYPYLGKYLLLK